MFGYNNQQVENENLFHLKISTTTAKIVTAIDYIIIQFDSQNNIIKSEAILNSTNTITLDANTSYIEIKTTHVNDNGGNYTLSERIMTKDINPSYFYTRMLTGDKGFIDYSVAQLIINRY